MVSERDKLVITDVIERVLGSPKQYKNDEYAYHCPFCNHHKKKLQVNLSSQKWHCWVCNTSGKKVHTLLNKLNVDERSIQRIKDIYEEHGYYRDEEKDEKKIIPTLPVEYKPLWKKPKGLNLTYNRALQYAYNRGISNSDILKYTIGFADDGEYSNRIIIPSYDSTNQLNYFIARSIYPDNKYAYKNPPISKKVIMFDNLINWKLPITLVEGAFDAIAVKRNAIPLLGKFIPKILMDRIFKEGVGRINIFLDNDAQEQALYYTNYFKNQGIEVHNITSDKKDPSLIGFNSVNTILRESKETGFREIINQKLNF